MRMINAIRNLLLNFMYKDCINIVEKFDTHNNPYEEIEMQLENLFPRTIVNAIIGCGIESPNALIIDKRMIHVGCIPEEFIFLYDLPNLV